MKNITITTPAISLNTMYRGRRFLTKDGKSTKEAMQYEFSSAWDKEVIEGDVALNVIFYFPDNRKRDCDSHLKALLDSMSGIVYKDDSQITELHVYKIVDKDNPRTIVSVL